MSRSQIGVIASAHHPIYDCSFPPFPAEYADPPYADAQALFFGDCWEVVHGFSNPTELLSGQHLVKGPAYFNMGTAELHATVVSGSEGEVARGTLVSLDALTGDATVSLRAMLVAQPTTPLQLFQGIGLSLEAVASGAGWVPRAVIRQSAGGTVTISGSTVIALSTETRVAVTHDVGPNTVKLYVNGVQVTSSTATVRVDDDGLVFFELPGSASWVGEVDVWSRALTAGEIPGAPLMPPVSAVHWWDFSDATTRSDTGSTINSITDKINSMVLNNAAGAVKDTIIGAAGLTCGRVNGYGGPFNRMTNSGFGISAQPMWVSMIVRVTPKPGGSEGVKANFFQLNSSATPTGRTGSLTIGDGDNHIYMSAGASLETAVTMDTYEHTIMWQFNGASSKIYLDGVQVASGNAGTNGASVGGQLTLFNAHTGGSESDTAIGEAVFGTGILTAPEIAGEHQRLAEKWMLQITFEDAQQHAVVVPDWATSAVLECWGAGATSAYGATNGLGAYIKGTIAGLTPGETLYARPGGLGVIGGVGGFNGGGDCGGLGGADGVGGGGASDIRRGGTALANRILIGGAGGGGAAPAFGLHTGGDAGYPVGFAGTAFSGNGQPGTQSVGGNSADGFTPPSTKAGSLGLGGSSSGGPGGGRGGGGGGAGKYGGGAGLSGFGVYSAGGGGSSGYDNTQVTLVTAETVGTWVGLGRVRITFLP